MSRLHTLRTKDHNKPVRFTEMSGRWFSTADSDYTTTAGLSNSIATSLLMHTHDEIREYDFFFFFSFVTVRIAHFHFVF